MGLEKCPFPTDSPWPRCGSASKKWSSGSGDLCWWPRFQSSRATPPTAAAQGWRSDGPCKRGTEDNIATVLEYMQCIEEESPATQFCRTPFRCRLGAASPWYCEMCSEWYPIGGGGRWWRYLPTNGAACGSLQVHKHCSAAQLITFWLRLPKLQRPLSPLKNHIKSWI